MIWLANGGRAEVDRHSYLRKVKFTISLAAMYVKCKSILIKLILTKWHLNLKSVVCVCAFHLSVPYISVRKYLQMYGDGGARTAQPLPFISTVETQYKEIWYNKLISQSQWINFLCFVYCLLTTDITNKSSRSQGSCYTEFPLYMAKI